MSFYPDGTDARYFDEPATKEAMKFCPECETDTEGEIVYGWSGAGGWVPSFRCGVCLKEWELDYGSE